MKTTACITTSWDDGHPLDLRLAELLLRYDLRGTFYVPRVSEKGTMTTQQLRELSRVFGIGAHTLHHVNLTAAPEEEAWREIADSRTWVEDNTSLPCPMFCPPQGKFSRRDLDLVRKAGYAGTRSVELLSLDPPRPRAGILLMPTTVQAHPHGILTYVRNAIRRASLRNLWRYFIHGRSSDWTRLARSLLSRVLARGGVFHLWGHSWELQENGQWRRLEDVFRFLSEFKNQLPALTNWEVCRVCQTTQLRE